MFFFHVQKKDNRLTSDIAEGIHVYGNADLLAQVVSNLIRNAAAHTVNGEIVLRTEKAEHEIQVTVQDTGCGISAGLLPHVFERGVSSGGTGFGLYLCKTVVESHGGGIWIESTGSSGTAASAYEGQLGGDGK